MLTSDRAAGTALVLLAVVTAWETRRLPLGTLHNPGPGYMPLVLALILGLLGVLVALRGGGSLRLGALRWPEAGHAVAILLGCTFAAVALERVGYRLTVIVLVGLLLGVMERKRPAVVAAVALGLSFASFFLFSNLLKVPLPRGPWGL